MGDAVTSVEVPGVSVEVVDVAKVKISLTSSFVPTSTDTYPLFSGRGAPMTRRDRGGPGVGRGGGGRASGGRRGENFKMDEESFPELSSAAGPTA